MCWTDEKVEYSKVFQSPVTAKQTKTTPADSRLLKTVRHFSLCLSIYFDDQIHYLEFTLKTEPSPSLSLSRLTWTQASG